MIYSYLQLAAPKELSLEGNLRESYRRFEEHWALFEKTELKERSEEDKCSYFLLCIGEKAREVYRTFDLPPETTTDTGGETTWSRTIKQLRDAFQQYCNPRKNITFERHTFNTRNQEEGETIDQYATILRTLASTCEFKDLKDGLIRDRIICGINNQNIRERLLRETDLTLEKTLNICRAAEHSRQQLKTMHESSNANIDAVRHKTTREISRPTDASRRQVNDQRKPCGNCGFSHRPRSCPAYGKKCDNCSRIGHFAKCCRSTQRVRANDKRVYDVAHEQSEWSGYDSDQGINHSL